jgi:multidrug efflux system membrane fusion protein
VVAATSHKGDIGVYYSGLGAVTPLATVTVKSRVDGQLVSIRYREGDTVHKGDLLVEIDDGPYQAALTQAEGELIRDQSAINSWFRRKPSRSNNLPPSRQPCTRTREW